MQEPTSWASLGSRPVSYWLFGCGVGRLEECIRPPGLNTWPSPSCLPAPPLKEKLTLFMVHLGAECLSVSTIYRILHLAALRHFLGLAASVCSFPSFPALHKHEILLHGRTRANGCMSIRLVPVTNHSISVTAYKFKVTCSGCSQFLTLDQEALQIQCATSQWHARRIGPAV